MGLPVSIPKSVFPYLAPDFQPIMHNGYSILNGTWDHGYAPEGEPAYAILLNPSIYLVMSPEDFDHDYPPLLSSSSMASMTDTPTPTTSEEPPMTTMVEDDQRFIHEGKRYHLVRRKRKYQELVQYV
jgi:hypothetical protein